MMGQAKQDTGYGMRAVCVARPAEITADDLHDAYVFARLRRIGIGYAQAIESPDILAALRGTALARKASQFQIKTNPSRPPQPLPASPCQGRSEEQSELFKEVL